MPKSFVSRTTPDRHGKPSIHGIHHEDISDFTTIATWNRRLHPSFTAVGSLINSDRPGWNPAWAYAEHDKTRIRVKKLRKANVTIEGVKFSPSLGGCLASNY